ncbi:MAG: hypothetical protein JSV42_07170 [Chloroflexota bacterium]|nr:MAG: hypothetical protein JSV42_07170 [Chloroflexota bacterium]
MKRKVWQALAIGIIFGSFAGISSVVGLTFLLSGITDNAIGFFVTLFLLAAALGGPLAGAIAPALWVTISAWFGPPEMVAVVSDPYTFWSNIIALGITTAIVGLAYRIIYERINIPVRLLAWAGIVIAYYFISLPASVIPQYLLSGGPQDEILAAVLGGYADYIPQMIFDILITSLVFIALPSAYARPLWYEYKRAGGQSGQI